MVKVLGLVLPNGALRPIEKSLRAARPTGTPKVGKPIAFYRLDILDIDYVFVYTYVYNVICIIYLISYVTCYMYMYVYV